MLKPNVALALVGRIAIATFLAVPLFYQQQGWAAGLCAFSGEPPGCIKAQDLAKNAVKSNRIANGQVQRADIRNNAIDSSKIQDRSIKAEDIAIGVIPAGGGTPGDNSVDSGTIRDGEVKNADIGPNAVTRSKIASGSVASDEIADKSIEGRDIKKETIRASELANNSVTHPKMAPNSVKSTEIEDGSVTGADIRDGTITGADLGTGSVTGADIGDGSLTGTDLSNSIRLGRSSGSGSLAIFDRGANRDRTFVGGGLVRVSSTDGSTAVLMATSGSGASQFGALWVYNAAGTITGGIRGDTGQVFANATLGSIVRDPSQPGRHINYAAIEGPEAAMYFRGSATLEQGRAFVALPAHFAELVNPASITVSLTPRDAHSLGLAALDVTATSVTVAELQGGVGSYSFDYVVYGTRKGFEDYQAYLYDDSMRSTALSVAAETGVAIEKLMFPVETPTAP